MASSITPTHAPTPRAQDPHYTGPDDLEAIQRKVRLRCRGLHARSPRAGAERRAGGLPRGAVQLARAGGIRGANLLQPVHAATSERVASVVRRNALHCATANAVQTAHHRLLRKAYGARAGVRRSQHQLLLQPARVRARFTPPHQLLLVHLPHRILRNVGHQLQHRRHLVRRGSLLHPVAQRGAA